MKIEELRIGDWYQYEENGEKRYAQVIKETFALSDEDLAKFEPIPITREFLLNNDFHANEMKDVKYDYLEKYGIAIHRHLDNNYDDSWTICVSSDEGYESATMCSIYYVHELQHFYDGIKSTDDPNEIKFKI